MLRRETPPSSRFGSSADDLHHDRSPTTLRSGKRLAANINTNKTTHEETEKSRLRRLLMEPTADDDDSHHPATTRRSGSSTRPSSGVRMDASRLLPPSPSSSTNRQKRIVVEEDRGVKGVEHYHHPTYDGVVSSEPTVRHRSSSIASSDASSVSSVHHEKHQQRGEVQKKAQPQPTTQVTAKQILWHVFQHNSFTPSGKLRTRRLSQSGFYDAIAQLSRALKGMAHPLFVNALPLNVVEPLFQEMTHHTTSRDDGGGDRSKSSATCDNTRSPSASSHCSSTASSTVGARAAHQSVNWTTFSATMEDFIVNNPNLISRELLDDENFYRSGTTPRRDTTPILRGKNHRSSSGNNRSSSIDGVSTRGAADGGAYESGGGSTVARAAAAASSTFGADRSPSVGDPPCPLTFAPAPTPVRITAMVPTNGETTPRNHVPSHGTTTTSNGAGAVGGVGPRPKLVHMSSFDGATPHQQQQQGSRRYDQQHQNQGEEESNYLVDGTSTPRGTRRQRREPGIGGGGSRTNSAASSTGSFDSNGYHQPHHLGASSSAAETVTMEMSPCPSTRLPTQLRTPPPSIVSGGHSHSTSVQSSQYSSHPQEYHFLPEPFVAHNRHRHQHPHPATSSAAAPLSDPALPAGCATSLSEPLGGWSSDLPIAHHQQLRPHQHQYHNFEAPTASYYHNHDDSTTEESGCEDGGGGGGGGLTPRQASPLRRPKRSQVLSGTTPPPAAASGTTVAGRCERWRTSTSVGSHDVGTNPSSDVVYNTSRSIPMVADHEVQQPEAPAAAVSAPITRDERLPPSNEGIVTDASALMPTSWYPPFKPRPAGARFLPDPEEATRQQQHHADPHSEGTSRPVPPPPPPLSEMKKQLGRREHQDENAVDVASPPAEGEQAIAESSTNTSTASSTLKMDYGPGKKWNNGPLRPILDEEEFAATVHMTPPPSSRPNRNTATSGASPPHRGQSSKSSPSCVTTTHPPGGKDGGTTPAATATSSTPSPKRGSGGSMMQTPSRREFEALIRARQSRGGKPQPPPAADPAVGSHVIVETTPTKDELEGGHLPTPARGKTSESSRSPQRSKVTPSKTAASAAKRQPPSKSGLMKLPPPPPKHRPPTHNINRHDAVDESQCSDASSVTDMSVLSSRSVSQDSQSSSRPKAPAWRPRSQSRGRTTSRSDDDSCGGDESEDGTTSRRRRSQTPSTRPLVHVVRGVKLVEVLPTNDPRVRKGGCRSSSCTSTSSYDDERDHAGDVSTTSMADSDSDAVVASSTRYRDQIARPRKSSAVPPSTSSAKPVAVPRRVDEKAVDDDARPALKLLSENVESIRKADTQGTAAYPPPPSSRRRNVPPAIVHITPSKKEKKILEEEQGRERVVHPIRGEEEDSDDVAANDARSPDLNRKYQLLRRAARMMDTTSDESPERVVTPHHRSRGGCGGVMTPKGRSPGSGHRGRKGGPGRTAPPPPTSPSPLAGSASQGRRNRHRRTHTSEGERWDPNTSSPQLDVEETNQRILFSNRRQKVLQF